MPDMVFLIYRIAEAMLQPSVTMYIYQAKCMQLYQNESICTNLKLYPNEEDQTQELSGHIIVWYRFFYDFPGIFVLPFCGAWIDQIGSRFAIMMPCFGIIMGVVCYLLSMIDSASFLPFLLLGSFVRSICGGAPLALTGVLSYVSDKSSDELRTSRVGITHSANMFGNVIGYTLLGIFFTMYGFKTVFYIVMILACFCLLCAVFLFHDIKSSKEPGKTSSLFSLHHLNDSFKVVSKQRSKGKRWKLLSLISVLMINQLGREGERDVVILYVSRRPLNWSKSLYGYLLTTEFMCMGLLTSVVLPVLSYKLMWHDLGIAIFGIAAKTIRALLLAFTHTTILVFVSTIIGTPTAMAFSAVTSQISKTVDQDEIGKVLAMDQFIQSLCGLIGAMGYPEIYSAAASVYPGLPFLINSVLYSIALAILSILACNCYNASEYEELNSDTLGSPKTPETLDNSKLPKNIDVVDSPQMPDLQQWQSEDHSHSGLGS